MTENEAALLKIIDTMCQSLDSIAMHSECMPTRTIARDIAAAVRRRLSPWLAKDVPANGKTAETETSARLRACKS